MKKGIIIGIIIVIIIGFGAIAVSANNSENVDEEISEISVDEEISEISVDEEIKNEPQQFEVELSESIGFTEG